MHITTIFQTKPEYLCVCVRVPSRMSSAALYRARILKSMRLFIDYEETLYASLTKGVRIVDISPIHPQEIIVDDKDSTHIMTLPVRTVTYMLHT